MSPNTDPSVIWRLHPGDYVILEETGTANEYRVVRKTTNDLECQAELNRAKYQGRRLSVMKFVGEV